MFRFFHRDVNIIEAGWLRGMSDIHCHLLPGVDDGVADIEESLELMHLMRECGIRRVSFSPHVFSLYPNNNSTTLRERFDTVKPIYQEEEMPCFLGGEYMIDEHFEERIAEPLLHIGTSDRLLVETSFAAPAYNFIAAPLFAVYLWSRSRSGTSRALPLSLDGGIRQNQV